MQVQERESSLTVEQTTSADDALQPEDVAAHAPGGAARQREEQHALKVGFIVGFLIGFIFLLYIVASAAHLLP